LFVYFLSSYNDYQKHKYLSMTELEKQCNANLVLPLFDRQSSDYCFQKSHEIFSKPLKTPTAFEQTESTSQMHNYTDDSLFDIENTIKSLDSDFLKRYNNLENLETSDSLLNKELGHNENNEVLQMEAQTLKKTEIPLESSDFFLNRRRSLKLKSSVEDMSREFLPFDKTLKSGDSTSRTENSNAPMFETCVESRNFRPSQNQFDCYRTLSFAYRGKNPNNIPQNLNNLMEGFNNVQNGAQHSRKNNMKNRSLSVRARNLRRLSYNQINMEKSSSSSDSDFAHSECNISSKTMRSKQSKRQTGNMLPNRKKLYGSSSSIKSAPHYYFFDEHHSFKADDDFNQQLYTKKSHHNTDFSDSNFDISEYSANHPTCKYFPGIQENNQISQLAQNFQWPQKIHASAVFHSDVNADAKRLQILYEGNKNVLQQYSSKKTHIEPDDLLFRGKIS
jgi:hypothetical protein